MISGKGLSIKIGDHRFTYSIQVILISFYVIAIFTPYIGAYDLLAVCLTGVAVLLCTAGQLVDRILHSKLIFTSAIFLMLCFLYRLLGISTASWGNYALIFLKFTSLWAGYYAWRYLDKSGRKNILIITGLVLAINIIDNIRLYKLYPNINVVLRGIEWFDKLNFGGTEFKYDVFLFGVFIFIFMWCNSLRGGGNN